MEDDFDKWISQEDLNKAIEISLNPLHEVEEKYRFPIVTKKKKKTRKRNAVRDKEVFGGQNNEKSKKPFLNTIKYPFIFVREEYRGNEQVILEAIRTNTNAFSFARVSLRNDRGFFLKAAKTCDFNKNLLDSRLCGSAICNDKEIAFLFLSKDTECVSNLGSKLIESSVILTHLKKFNGDVEKCFDELEKNGISENAEEEDIFDFFINKLSMHSSFLSHKFESINLSILEIEEEQVKKDKAILSSNDKNKIRFHRVLGKGAYGRAYLCSVPGLGLMVVKIYNDPSMKKTKKEELMSRDSLYIPYHPNVVSILHHSDRAKIRTKNLPDYEEEWKFKKKVWKRCAFIWMRYHRIDLLTYIENREKTKFSKRVINVIGAIEVFKMFEGLCSGIFHLHENMIVHRDLHTKNIFVDPKNGRILIGDFGCALDLRQNNTGFVVDANHEQMFSISYSDLRFKEGGYCSCLPPEISNFDKSKSQFLDYSKSDLYSVGIVGKFLLDQISTKEIEGYAKHNTIVKLLHELVSNLLLPFQQRLSFTESERKISKIRSTFYSFCCPISRFFENMKILSSTSQSSLMLRKDAAEELSRESEAIKARKKNDGVESFPMKDDYVRLVMERLGYSKTFRCGVDISGKKTGLEVTRRQVTQRRVMDFIILEADHSGRRRGFVERGKVYVFEMFGYYIDQILDSSNSISEDLFLHKIFRTDLLYCGKENEAVPSIDGNEIAKHCTVKSSVIECIFNREEGIITISFRLNVINNSLGFLLLKLRLGILEVVFAVPVKGCVVKLKSMELMFHSSGYIGYFQKEGSNQRKPTKMVRVFSFEKIL